MSFEIEPIHNVRAVDACTDALDLEGTKACFEYPPVALAPALRARALFSRSKAYVDLNRQKGALRDARAAAFFGDRKTVALYGKWKTHAIVVLFVVSALVPILLDG
jgi:hypothetical protein